MKIRKNYINRLITAIIAGILIAVLGGCVKTESKVDENMLGADLQSGLDKTVITVTASAGLNHFAAAVEEHFPDIRLVQDSYMGEFRINEHIARVENKDWGDLVMIKAGLIPKADISGLLMDLSIQPFPSNYNSNALQMDDEGHIYLLPGPLSFNCNIYNKTLFDENGWSVPKNYEELLALCQVINKSGIDGYQFVLKDSSMQSYQIYNYCVLSALDTLTNVKGQTWHNQLMAGQNVSLEPMEVSFKNLQRLIEAGMVRIEDMDVTGEVRLKKVLNRKAAITPGMINVLHQLNEEGTDEFRFMPHYSMTDGKGWLLSLGYYFGANQELGRSGNEKKLEAVMKILEFLASEEGQQALIEDDLGMIPAIRGAKLPDDPAFDEIKYQVESGHYVMRPTYDMFTPVLETEIAAFIRGETTSDAVLDKCGELLLKGASGKEAIGQALNDFSVLETGLLKADALREALDADIALVGMAEADCYVPVGGTRSRLYTGNITEDDVTRITQITTGEQIRCCRAEITGEKLLALLNYGAASKEEQEASRVSHFHPFAVSGIILSYDLDSESGKHIEKVCLSNGNKLNPDSTYTVAFLEGALQEEFLTGVEKTEYSMTGVFGDYIAKKKNVIPDKKRVSFR